MSEKEKPQSRFVNEQTEAAIIEELETLAVVRTAHSSERSLMAWMRTSISLFTFGFSITKFIDYLAQRQGTTQFSASLHRLGVALVCMGILGLMFAVVEHAHRIRRAKELGLQHIARFSLPIAATVALLVIMLTTLLLL